MLNLTSIEEDANKLTDSGAGRIRGVRIDGLAEQVLLLLARYAEQQSQIERLTSTLKLTKRRMEEACYLIDNSVDG
jgi:hypothetical protein